MSVEEKGIEVIGIGNKTVTVKTLDGQTGNATGNDRNSVDCHNRPLPSACR